ncbi:Protein trichome birefringence-like 19, partial [Mucuna pruriens]
MKFLHVVLLSGNNSPKQTMSKVTLLAFLTLLIFVLTTLSCSLFSYYPLLKMDEYKQPSFEFDNLVNETERLVPSKPVKKCDIFSGEWVPNPEAPYYTNTTCWEIHEHQNCIKHGRPDSEFMKWRWKPNECELPIFNPFNFLEIVRGKSMAFVGDSIGRNHMQSMICLLSRPASEYVLHVSKLHETR